MTIEVGGIVAGFVHDMEAVVATLHARPTAFIHITGAFVAKLYEYTKSAENKFMNIHPVCGAIIPGDGKLVGMVA